MADFSSYGGASDEWLAVAATLPTPPEQSLEELKAASNANREKAAAEQMKAFEDKVVVTDHSIPTRDSSHIQARTYRAASNSNDSLPVYIHLHGGGFLFGTLSSEDPTCARIATSISVVVVNVNYRHTPDYTFPTAWNDADDALDWVFANAASFGGDPDQVIIGGSSAGGYLSAATTLSRHLTPKTGQKIKGQILLIPALVQHAHSSRLYAKLSSPEASSYIENEDAPILPVSRIQLFNKLLKVPCDIAENDVRANPANASDEDVKGLPPTVVGVAGLDPLRDQGLLFAKLLAENGVPTNVTVFRGVPHGFRRFGEKLSMCKKWDDVVVDGISWILSDPKPTGRIDVKT